MCILNRDFNRDSRCASWITIQNTVFWTVCTPNHVEIRDLRCITRKHLWTVIWDAHLKSRISTWFGVHTVQIPYFESWFKMRISNHDSKYALCRRVKTVLERHCVMVLCVTVLCCLCFVSCSVVSIILVNIGKFTRCYILLHCYNSVTMYGWVLKFWIIT